MFVQWLCGLCLTVVCAVTSWPLHCSSAMAADAEATMRIVETIGAPAVFSPNGDGLADNVAIRSVLSIKGSGQSTDAVLVGTVTVSAGDGRQIAVRESATRVIAAPGTWGDVVVTTAWDGTTDAGAPAADGIYRYNVTFDLLKGCQGRGDNRDDMHSGQVDLLGDCSSGTGNDTRMARLIGAAGPASGELTIDTAPPQITIAGVSDGEYRNREVAPVISISDPYLAGSAALLDGGPYTVGTTINEEGFHILEVSARDTAGNTALVTLGFTLDTTPPILAISSPADGSHIDDSTPRFDIVYADSVSGIDLSRIELTLDGRSLEIEAPTSSGLSYLPRESLAEGAHTLVVAVYDRAGNRSEVSSGFVIKSRCAIVPPPNGKTFPPLIYPEPGFDTETYQGLYNFGTFSKFQIGDLNRDGILDMVGVDYYSTPTFSYRSRLTVMLGKGDGRFEKKTSFAEVESASEIASLELSDFDADCNLDLAVTRNSPDELYVFLGQGDGTFVSRQGTHLRLRVGCSVDASTGTSTKISLHTVLPGQSGCLPAMGVAHLPCRALLMLNRMTPTSSTWT